VLTVSAGHFHTCALQPPFLYCWGRNDRGQVGIGDNTFSPNAPELVEVWPTRGTSRLAAGGSHTCYLTLNRGAVWCWGWNFFGQFGNGTTTSSDRPRQIPAFTNSRLIGTGNEHTCAVWGRAVWCTGRNRVGQLGDGTNLDKRSPVQVGHGIEPSVLGVGWQHACAAREINGPTWCWGDNSRGQLGDGTTISRNWPTRVVDLPDGVRSLSTFHAETCAAINDGRLYCWGKGRTRARRMALPYLRVRGKAILRLSKLPVGRHVVKAVFTGNATHAPSRSKSIGIIVRADGTVEVGPGPQ
jgi:alpha-tubulin suppressor-like RCC1 family protein